MARPTLGTHPKFFRLAALVGGRAIARGSLELIWDAAYASGDPLIGDAVAVEAVADWRGDAGVLTSALVSSGFLDVVQLDANGNHLHEFAVHDLEDHAPDYVLKRWEREAKRRANGETLREVRQRAAAARWAADDATVRRVQSNVLPPAPAPAPAHQIQIAPPAGAHDPSTTATGPTSNTPPAANGAATDPSGPAAEKLTGWWLVERFGRVRAEFVEHADPASKPRPSGGKAQTLAEDLVADGRTTTEVLALLRLFFRKAKAGEYGADSAKMLDDPTFAFGCWASKLGPLREELAGRKPTPATARGSPSTPPASAYCDWHQQPRSRGRPSKHPRPGCPECKHIDARSRERSGEPTETASIIASIVGQNT